MEKSELSSKFLLEEELLMKRELSDEDFNVLQDI